MLRTVSPGSLVNDFRTRVPAGRLRCRNGTGSGSVLLRFLYNQLKKRRISASHAEVNEFW